MTIAVFSFKNNTINKVNVSGHADYDIVGKDIVCSAISVSMLMTKNLLDKVCPKFDFKMDDKNTDMYFEIFENNKFTNIVLNNLLEVLTSISNQYPKNLKIKYVK